MQLYIHCAYLGRYFLQASLINDLLNCPSSGWTKHLWVYVLMLDVPRWMCIERPKRFCEKYVQTKGKYGIRIYIWWGVGSTYQIHGKLWGVYGMLTRRKGLPRNSWRCAQITETFYAHAKHYTLICLWKSWNVVPMARVNYNVIMSSYLPN